MNTILKITPKIKAYTVFDAIRDNRGQGIKAEDLTQILKKQL
ncbi:MAG: hypothetical protein V1765_03220 [bacterium]